MKFKLLAFYAFVIFAFPFHAFASAPMIISFPSTINMNDQFNIEATMSGLSDNAVYRLRIALSEQSTSSYFGSTYNGSEWYSGSPFPIDYSKFLSITTDMNGSWNGTILGKLESTDSNYKNTGSGNYDLKLGRYTQTGSTSTWSNIVTVAINAPSSTPTNTVTPKPSSTNTPTQKPTATFTPTPVAKSIPTKSQITLTEEDSNQVPEQKVLSADSQAPTGIEKSKKFDEKVKGISVSDNSLIPKVMIALGGIFLLTCAIVAAYPIIKKYKDERFNN